MSESKRRGRFADFFTRFLKEQPLGTIGGIIVLILILWRSLPMIWPLMDMVNHTW